MTRRGSSLSYPLTWPEAIDLRTLWARALRHILTIVSLPRPETALTHHDEAGRANVPEAQTPSAQTPADYAPSGVEGSEASTYPDGYTNAGGAATTLSP